MINVRGEGDKNRNNNRREPTEEVSQPRGRGVRCCSASYCAVPDAKADCRITRSVAARELNKNIQFYRSYCSPQLETPDAARHVKRFVVKLLTDSTDIDWMSQYFSPPRDINTIRHRHTTSQMNILTCQANTRRNASGWPEEAETGLSEINAPSPQCHPKQTAWPGPMYALLQYLPRPENTSPSVRDARQDRVTDCHLDERDRAVENTSPSVREARQDRVTDCNLMSETGLWKTPGR
ncbi:hypothetical protein RRG08_017492 [Elysia crispata]|uniref:Uncharacterized protein n=1 Tax=Elysia crispata TaxID=231223 RepID=A0AAE0YJ03_9GAST|nr:hypothetical protein RRG08_017492 [Elysia crispata]